MDKKWCSDRCIRSELQVVSEDPSSNENFKSQTLAFQSSGETKEVPSLSCAEADSGERGGERRSARDDSVVEGDSRAR